jgi:hypothetical protein
MNKNTTNKILVNFHLFSSYSLKDHKDAELNEQKPHTTLTKNKHRTERMSQIYSECDCVSFQNGKETSP